MPSLIPDRRKKMRALLIHVSVIGPVRWNLGFRAKHRSWPRLSSRWSEVMNWDQVEGQWKQVKGKVLEQWGKLTNDDLDEIAGKRDQLIGKVQQRYGMAKEEAEREVDDWTRGS
jgi:uncharacterized protein YjbJ (UPF0337 family)